jgi:hypothetical protein
VARAAGRDLARINSIPVTGFGFIDRTAPTWPLLAEHDCYSGFVLSYLPDPWPGQLSELFTGSELGSIEQLLATERDRTLTEGQLAHGDFDTTRSSSKPAGTAARSTSAKCEEPNCSTTSRTFYLHDQEQIPIRLIDDLLSGYREHQSLPYEHEQLIRTSSGPARWPLMSSSSWPHSAT